MLEVIICCQFLIIMYLVVALVKVQDDVMDRKLSVNANDYVMLKETKKEVKVVPKEPEVLVDAAGNPIPEHELKKYVPIEDILSHGAN